MAIYSDDVKELWCDECSFKKTYDADQQAEGDYARDWEQWRRDGCPECGHQTRTDYGPAYAGQA